MGVEILQCCGQGLLNQDGVSWSGGSSGRRAKSIGLRCGSFGVRGELICGWAALKSAFPRLYNLCTTKGTCMFQQLKYAWLEILNIQRFRRMAGYTAFYCFAAVVSFAHTNNTKRAGFSNADQFYASFAAGTELLTGTGKVYAAPMVLEQRNEKTCTVSSGHLNGAFWLNTLSSKGNHRMHIMSNIWHTSPPSGNWMEAASF